MTLLDTIERLSHWRQVHHAENAELSLGASVAFWNANGVRIHTTRRAAFVAWVTAKARTGKRSAACWSTIAPLGTRHVTAVAILGNAKGVRIHTIRRAAFVAWVAAKARTGKRIAACWSTVTNSSIRANLLK